MVKIDLITGFLGSGKTTFIRGYIEYLLKQGEKICILENDYGAINVDMMLLSGLKSENLDIQMVAGGCDYDCHIRRFKTKLITMAMLGYNRVLVEPSGIFDIDEFYDILHEDALYNRYQIDNVLAIVNANLEEECSSDMDYMLASQVATAGRIILSRVQLTDQARINHTIAHINKALKGIGCKRSFDDKSITIKDWSTFSDEDYYQISHAGYQETAFIKNFSMDDTSFQPLFFMNVTISKDEVLSSIEKIWNDTTLGNIMRIKGFIQDENKNWVEVNSTKENTEVNFIDEGQEIIIVIGENLNAEKIAEYFPSVYSTIHTS